MGRGLIISYKYLHHNYFIYTESVMVTPIFHMTQLVLCWTRLVVMVPAKKSHLSYCSAKVCQDRCPNASLERWNRRDPHGCTPT